MLSGQSEQLAEMISYFKVDAAMGGRRRQMQVQSAPVEGQQQSVVQPKLAHAAGPVFQSNAKSDGEVFEASGKRDALDNQFEEF